MPLHASTPSLNNNSGDEDVHHMYVVPNTQLVPYRALPTPNKQRPPPSMPLKGEKTGQQSSGHADEAATHLEVPTDESTTTPPVSTPPDEKSSREGRGMAMSHREVAGARDGVEGSNDEWDDEEGQENREEDEHNSPAPAPPPSPPPLSNHTAPPAPSPNHPE
ncbi:hypothetical protein PAXINDRAFT_11797 [Paxillus involutus ATCC 200175]|uniref:Uncharacterized protein n=1 Tax=Paxillus involutus ATCC 200175 TaxID=664439 RepID=A0A0C9THW4_PAXIN|nr:hypothetical protein PAXINDRAFT_11797 [Paxillus involutus ATCC 200175]